MVMHAMHRVMADITQGIMHPAHVPFHRKAQAACPGGAGYLWPGGRLFSHNDGAGVLLVGDRIHFP